MACCSAHAGRNLRHATHMPTGAGFGARRQRLVGGDAFLNHYRFCHTLHAALAVPMPSASGTVSNSCLQAYRVCFRMLCWATTLCWMLTWRWRYACRYTVIGYMGSGRVSASRGTTGCCLI